MVFEITEKHLDLAISKGTNRGFSNSSPLVEASNQFLTLHQWKSGILKDKLSEEQLLELHGLDELFFTKQYEKLRNLLPKRIELGED